MRITSPIEFNPGSEGQAGESLRNAERDFRCFPECQIPVMQKARQTLAIEGGTTRDQPAVERLTGIVEQGSGSGDELGHGMHPSSCERRHCASSSQPKFPTDADFLAKTLKESGGFTSVMK
jgi:hypothetical protein